MRIWLYAVFVLLCTNHTMAQGVWIDDPGRPGKRIFVRPSPSDDARRREPSPTTDEEQAKKMACVHLVLICERNDRDPLCTTENKSNCPQFANRTRAQRQESPPPKPSVGATPKYCLSNVCLGDEAHDLNANWLGPRDWEFGAPKIYGKSEGQETAIRRFFPLMPGPGIAQLSRSLVLTSSKVLHARLYLLDQGTTRALATYSGSICGFVMFSGMFRSESGHPTLVVLNGGVLSSGRTVLAVSRIMRHFQIDERRQEEALVQQLKTNFPDLIEKGWIIKEGWTWKRPTRPIAVVERHVSGFSGVRLQLVHGGFNADAFFDIVNKPSLATIIDLVDQHAEKLQGCKGPPQIKLD